MRALTEKVSALKKEKNALILAHYYQPAEIQELADFTGDSYYLSKTAKEARESLIVFCGVRFMAESAKALAPQKMILLPVAGASCPMADMAVLEEIETLKRLHPAAALVCYINSPARVKALCQVCVTSANAEKIIPALPEREIIFLPDKNLGAFLAGKFPDKKFINYPGYCPVHQDVKTEEILRLKNAHPGAPVAAHPECTQETLALADFVGGTEAILRFAKAAPEKEMIIVTEEGLRYALEKQNPRKNFHFPQPPMLCQDMKKTGSQDVLLALERESGQIALEEGMRLGALRCLEEMLRLSV
ncbi:MAG: quinolinate synthase NadA [Clostridiales bacterium]|nr:quinolinate synthase NadA [Clostridiales bacterium]